MGYRRFQARPEVVEDPQELQRRIRWLIARDPTGARTLMGWDAERDDPEAADFSPMVEKVVTVRFHTR